VRATGPRGADSAGILRYHTHDKPTATPAATAAATGAVARTDHESPALATTGATAAIPNRVARWHVASLDVSCTDAKAGRQQMTTGDKRRTSRRLRSVALLVAAILTSGMAARGAPQQTGSIAGTISDVTGEPLPGVRIVVMGPQAREAITNLLGRYTIDSLPPGRYRIEAHMAGFETKISAVSVSARAAADWSGAILIAPLIGEVPIEPRVMKHTAWDAVDCGRRLAEAEAYQLEKSLNCIVDSARQRRPAAVIVKYTAVVRGGYGLLTGSDGVIHYFRFGYARLDFNLRRCESPRVTPDTNRGVFIFACE
jgi:hypothetical protein